MSHLVLAFLLGSFIYSTSQNDDYAKIASMLKSFQKMSRDQITCVALACVPFLTQITNSLEAKSQTFKNHLLLTELGLISSGENAARHY